MAGLVVAELVVRRISPDRPFRVAESLFKTERKPLNSARYRDYDYPNRKEPGEFRIVMAGDSFTEGKSINFDDIFPKKLERYLNTLLRS